MNMLTFAVSPFKNRNGAVSWRVDGNPPRPSHSEELQDARGVAVEKATLALKALQKASGLRSVATSLSEGQVRDAEALFPRVVSKPRPLSSYVDFALTNYR